MEMHLEDEDSFPLLSINPALVKIATLGHQDLYMDLAYFWLLQSLIVPENSLENADEIYRKIHLLMKHHPKIESLYTLSCFVMALDYHRPKLCEEFANEGMKALPKSWMIPATTAYMFAFVLKDPVKGSYFYKKTESLPQRPDFLVKLSERLMQGGVHPEDGDQALRSMIEEADDPDYKEFLIRYLNKQH